MTTIFFWSCALGTVASAFIAWLNILSNDSITLVMIDLALLQLLLLGGFCAIMAGEHSGAVFGQWNPAMHDTLQNERRLQIGGRAEDSTFSEDTFVLKSFVVVAANGCLYFIYNLSSFKVLTYVSILKVTCHDQLFK